MASRTLSLLRSKGQFFILSAFVMVTILYFMSKWIEPYTIPDTSSIALMGEPFLFNNIKEKAIETINQSKSCDELKYNIQEYRLFVESYAFERGYDLDFNYTVSPCPEEVPPPPSPTVVAFRITLTSPSVYLNSNFSIGYPGTIYHSG